MNHTSSQHAIIFIKDRVHMHPKPVESVSSLRSFPCSSTEAIRDQYRADLAIAYKPTRCTLTWLHFSNECALDHFCATSHSGFDVILWSGSPMHKYNPNQMERLEPVYGQLEFAKPIKSHETFLFIDTVKAHEYDVVVRSKNKAFQFISNNKRQSRALDFNPFHLTSAFCLCRALRHLGV